MPRRTEKRYQSGDICVEAGWYEFAGYVGAVLCAPPRGDELKIPVSVGDLFPAIRTTTRECYWRAISAAVTPESAAAGAFGMTR